MVKQSTSSMSATFGSKHEISGFGMWTTITITRTLHKQGRRIRGGGGGGGGGGGAAGRLPPLKKWSGGISMFLPQSQTAKHVLKFKLFTYLCTPVSHEIKKRHLASKIRSCPAVCLCRDCASVVRVYAIFGEYPGPSVRPV